MRATLPERYRHGVVRAALDQHVTGIGEHRRERGRGLPASLLRIGDLRRGWDAQTWTGTPWSASSKAAEQSGVAFV